MAPNVTVCIPAYRSEAFIHNTLRSVLTQTYSDFVVEIAVEPPAEETLSACGAFLRDEPRQNNRQSPGSRLGRKYQESPAARRNALFSYSSATMIFSSLIISPLFLLS